MLDQIRYRKELEEPIPEAVDLLSTLSKKYQIGVIADQSAGTEARLNQYGLDPFISLCFSSAEIGLT